PAAAVPPCRQQPSSVVGRVELNLGDAGKVLADHVGVGGAVGPELVKVDLLVEVRICRGPLVSLRIARVVEPGAVVVPGDAAAGSGEVYPRDTVAQFAAGRGLEDARRA